MVSSSIFLHDRLTMTASSIPHEPPKPQLAPARVYEERFVPAFFSPWADRLAAGAGAETAASMLDVACGTGALTRALVARRRPGAVVTGLDALPDMLAVAAEVVPEARFVGGRAEALPFEDAEFDLVASQFALMFFDDPVLALREMWRTLRPSGRLRVAVCGALDHSPAYAVLAELLQRLFGAEVADGFRAPFRLGCREELARLCRHAELPRFEVSRRDGNASFASVKAMVAAEGACVWTLGGRLDANRLERLEREAEESLAPFVGGDGRLEFCAPILVVDATRP